MQEHKDRAGGASWLCLSCGQQFEAGGEQPGEKAAVPVACPACRSPHILMLTTDSGRRECGSGGGRGFGFG